jgi:CheY-like chemotaxis protein
MHPVVLLVDDDDDFRSVLGEVLRDEGCHVLEAANGEEALAILNSVTPHAIFVDLIMPVLNGWSLSALLAMRQELNDVPVAFLSAVPQMAPPGGSLVLKKPLDLPGLLRLVDAVRHEPASSEIRLKTARPSNRADRHAAKKS